MGPCKPSDVRERSSAAQAVGATGTWQARWGAGDLLLGGLRRAVMLMLVVYAKNEAEDLTQAQIKMPGEGVRKEFHDE